jgi:hypothetical protein
MHKSSPEGISTVRIWLFVPLEIVSTSTFLEPLDNGALLDSLYIDAKIEQHTRKPY